MQQRRLRLGDILDDYCPRERRITNHAVVAMIDDEVKQTRCTTCDADHEYKEAKVPTLRRKKASEASPADLLDPARPRPVASVDPPSLDEEDDTSADAALALPEPVIPDSDDAAPLLAVEDEGPVHRPLIRATLPRPEGQLPERKAPDFTMRQPGGRGREGEGKRGGNRPRGRRQAQGPSGGQPARFGGPAPPRHGNNRPGPGGGQRGGGRPAGQGRGPRQGPGRGPKRGR